MDAISFSPSLLQRLHEAQPSLLVAMAQGHFAHTLIKGAEIKEKFGVPMAQLMRECYAHYRDSGEEEHSQEALLANIASRIGGDTETAKDIMLLYDLTDLLMHASISIAQGKLSAGDFSLMREQRMWMDELKAMLIEDGGLGPHQASLLEQQCKKTVESLVLQQMAATETSQQR